MMNRLLMAWAMACLTLALLKGGEGDRGIRDHLHDDAVQVRLPLEIIRVGLERHVVASDPLLDLPWPGANGDDVVLALGEVLFLPDVLGEDPAPEVREEDRVRLFELEHHGVRARD